jgi:hypothetical protein
LEAAYLGEWEPAYRRAANTGKANVDLIRAVLLLSRRLRAAVMALEGGAPQGKRRER